VDDMGLQAAVTLAKENQQLAIWDLSSRPWAIALYHDDTKELRPLTDEQAAILLNRDPAVAREWRKWNAMNGNRGSLIVLDSKRVRRILGLHGVP
jgi:hypothetical protein